MLPEEEKEEEEKGRRKTKKKRNKREEDNKRIIRSKKKKKIAYRVKEQHNIRGYKRRTNIEHNDFPEGKHNMKHETNERKTDSQEEKDN